MWWTMHSRSYSVIFIITILLCPLSFSFPHLILLQLAISYISQSAFQQPPVKRLDKLNGASCFIQLRETKQFIFRREQSGHIWAFRIFFGVSVCQYGMTISSLVWKIQTNDRNIEMSHRFSLFNPTLTYRVHTWCTEYYLKITISSKLSNITQKTLNILTALYAGLSKLVKINK